MYHLKRLIIVAKRQSNIPALLKDPETGALSNTERPFRTDFLLHFIEHVVPFVFIRGPDDSIEVPSEYKTGPVDAPFDVFSLEMLGDIPLSGFRPDDPYKTECYCAVVVDVESVPIIFALIKMLDPESGLYFDRVVVVSELLPLVRAYVSKLNKLECGVEQVNHRVLISKNRRQSKYSTIRRVVYVRPKTSARGGGGLESRSIDWSHRWLVRGHWRRVAGLGKDRAGNYCVNGFTWVSSFEKGPVDAPLINKTRIVSKGDDGGEKPD